MKQKLKEYLTNLCLLNEEEINYSLTFFEATQLKKEMFFITEDAICDKVAFIVKGGVRAFSTNSNGEENITCFKFENQFITSYESFTLQQLSKKSIQAIEDCNLLVINFNQVNHLLDAIPSWKLIIKSLIEQEFIDKENYLINFNNKSAKEKYLQILTHSPEIIKRVKVSHLASYLSITQRTLTRIKKEIFQTAF